MSSIIFVAKKGQYIDIDGNIINIYIYDDNRCEVSYKYFTSKDMVIPHKCEVVGYLKPEKEIDIFEYGKKLIFHQFTMKSWIVEIEDL